MFDSNDKADKTTHPGVSDHETMMYWYNAQSEYGGQSKPNEDDPQPCRPNLGRGVCHGRSVCVYF